MGGSSGGGMGGGMITNIASSVANVGAGWFASHNLNKGSRFAAEQQEKANALYRDLYGQTQADYKPYQEGGQSAYADLLKSYGVGGEAQDMTGFYDSPDYTFALSQGQNALDRSAASRGRLYSGQQQKASQEFGQGLATQYLGNYRTGLGNLSNMGLDANNALANYRQGYGNQLGQGITNIGDIEYARRLGRANINYRNVAAQDSIWGSGGGQQQGGQQGMGGQSSYGGGTINTSGLTNGLNFGASNYGQYNWGGG